MWRLRLCLMHLVFTPLCDPFYPDSSFTFRSHSTQKPSAVQKKYKSTNVMDSMSLILWSMLCGSARHRIGSDRIEADHISFAGARCCGVQEPSSLWTNAAAPLWRRRTRRPAIWDGGAMVNYGFDGYLLVAISLLHKCSDRLWWLRPLDWTGRRAMVRAESVSICLLAAASNGTPMMMMENILNLVNMLS